MCGYACMQCGACKGTRAGIVPKVPCTACGALNDPGRELCESCGAPLEDITPGIALRYHERREDGLR